MARINEDFDEEYQKSQPTLAKYRVEEDDDTQVYKKPWVGLTEDEVKRCGFAIPFDGAQDWALRFSQAIEAKLKEKNA